MRPMARWCLCAVLLTWAAGCQKMHETKAFDLHTGEVRDIHISAPTYGQTVKVVATSSDSPIAVYVVLEKDFEAVHKALMNYKEPDQAMVLASGKDSKELTVEAKVPAKNEYAVLVARANKKTKVDLDITGS